MSFDKTKAMRNAERFLAQGKIRAAINEYKRVVEFDPKDFTTLNMLGDLYAKASDTKEAMTCFNQVAEYYGQQGFSQKAIAVYNKISRLSPNSFEISAKLAELYQMKGSVAEARSHYAALAEHYQRAGNKAEALTVLKQIAEIDKNNTEIYLKIAEAYWQENQHEEAATAFIQGALRLSKKKQYESAITAFSRGLELRPNDLTGLKGIVEAQIHLGYTDEAAKTLEKVLEKEPYNREVIFLLVDCYLDTDNPNEAEKVVIQLVEREPANYPKFLDLVKSYLKKNDLASAARILSMTSEHLLVGGQAGEFEKWVNEILARDPEHVETLRLLVRLHGWQRDEAELKDALERLAEAAHLSGAVEDERYALTQLVIMLPYEADYAKKLQEINEKHGYAEVAIDYQPKAEEQSAFAAEVPAFQNISVESNGFESNTFESNSDYGAEIVDYSAYEFVPETTNGNGHAQTESKDFAFNEQFNTQVFVDDYPAAEAFAMSPVEEFHPTPEISENGNGKSKRELDPFEAAQLEQELESVEFYISQEYFDLAANSLDMIAAQFGNRPEIENLRQSLHTSKPETPVVIQPASEPEEIQSVMVTENQQNINGLGFDILDEFRSELGLEEADEPAGTEDDYETHYHLGIAYKEMGLVEDAIREFQDAVKLVQANDGTRNFLLCCNLLGHCFMEKQMPNLGLMWYKRGLETASIDREERQGLRYEIANAYEEAGEMKKAIEYFEEIYVENVDYRDVAERLKFLRAA